MQAAIGCGYGIIRPVPVRHRLRDLNMAPRPMGRRCDPSWRTVAAFSSQASAIWNVGSGQNRFFDRDFLSAARSLCWNGVERRRVLVTPYGFF
jgi:hypothetical protein